jgi:hypothetical protein
MTCPFSDDDGAYVLGALSPNERLEFERHLDGCEACKRSIRELAGLPGLLGRVDAAVLEHPPVDEPLPDTLLPVLSREVRRKGRRRTLAASGLAAAAVAAVATALVPVVVAKVGGADTPSAAASSPSPGIVSEPMAAVGEVPVQASVSLEPVTWGTRLWLTCTYEPDDVEYDLPPAVDYTLFVRTRTGHTERVGSWRSVGGQTMRLTAATSTRRGDISSVEVRTPDGRVVLRLAA